MITLSITSAGIPWSASELARITPDPEAPLCSVQQQLEALGYRVTAIQGSGMEVSAEVEVTGESITDEQIEEVRESTIRITSKDADDLWNDCRIALGGGYVQVIGGPEVPPSDEEIAAARDRCAGAVNAANARAFDTAMAKAALEHNLRGGRS